MTENKNSLTRMMDDQLSRREKNYNLNEPHHRECICLNDTVTCQNRQYSNHKTECCKVGLKDRVIVLWPNNSKNAIDFTSSSITTGWPCFPAWRIAVTRLWFAFVYKLVTRPGWPALAVRPTLWRKSTADVANSAWNETQKSRIVLQNWISCFIHYETVTGKRNSRKYWNKRSHKA